MKIYAISDIHGYLQELEEALAKIDLSGDNKLILLGDYIHGPSSYGVLDRIIGLQNQYGTEKVVALMGNHEEMALGGQWPINTDVFYYDTEETNEEKEEKFLSWMSNLPLYYEIGNAIFVHAGIDEEAAAAGYFEYGTSEEFFTSKFPAEVGKIEGFDKKIVAGHVGTHNIAEDPRYHDIYFDGFNHYYIDGTVQASGEIPVIMYDTQTDKFYRVTDSGAWIILPYNEEN